MLTARSVRERLDQLFKQRIVIFDGSTGVLLQHKGLTEADYRGERFRNHSKLLRNDVDILNLTRPEIVEQTHVDYLEAGADIVTTNTFTATPITQRDYELTGLVYEMNKAGAEISPAAAGRYGNRFVRGPLGPTHSTLSLSPAGGAPPYPRVPF